MDLIQLIDLDPKVRGQKSPLEPLIFTKSISSYRIELRWSRSLLISKSQGSGSIIVSNVQSKHQLPLESFVVLNLVDPFPDTMRRMQH